MMQLFSEAFTSPKDSLELEYKVVHRKGHVLDMYASVVSVKHDGELVGFNAVIADVTERKMAEEALSESQRRQLAILSNIPDMAWMKDKESRYIAVNEQFGRECGISPEELVGKTFAAEVLVQVVPGTFFDVAADAVDVELSLDGDERLGFEADVVDMIVPAGVLAEGGQRHPRRGVGPVA